MACLSEFEEEVEATDINSKNRATDVEARCNLSPCGKADMLARPLAPSRVEAGAQDSVWLPCCVESDSPERLVVGVRLPPRRVKLAGLIQDWTSVVVRSRLNEQLLRAVDKTASLALSLRGRASLGVRAYGFERVNAPKLANRIFRRTHASCSGVRESQ
jgi:hypothetical protein